MPQKKYLLLRAFVLVARGAAALYRLYTGLHMGQITEVLYSLSNLIGIFWSLMDNTPVKRKVTRYLKRQQVLCLRKFRSLRALKR